MSDLQRITEDITGQEAANIIYDNDNTVNTKFLTDRSFSGFTNIDYGHLVNFSSESVYDSYKESDNYDTAWVQIFEPSDTLTIAGANITRVIFFNALQPSSEAYISSSSSLTPNIPSNAKLALLTLLKADNPDGYLNLTVKQNGAGATKAELTTELKPITTDVSEIKEAFYQYPKGKNYLNPANNLYGWYTSNGQWVERKGAISSNPLFLEDGETYIASAVGKVYLTDNAYLCHFNKQGVFLGRDTIIVDDNNNIIFTFSPISNTNGTTHFTRLMLATSANNSYDPNAAQLEKGAVATKFESYKGTIFSAAPPETVNTDVLRNFLITGASFSYPGNAWGNLTAERLGVKVYNKGVSGETIRDTAQKLHDGTLYTAEEFEDFGILLVFHSHNTDVYNPEICIDDYNEYTLPFPATVNGRVQAWDYVLKKYAAECYAAKDNPASKWYNTRCGKPCIISVCTHWHDARTLFNNSIRELRDQWGFILIELDKLIGFSMNKVHPVTNTQVSLIHAADTETINSVVYGWHPDRAANSYIQQKIAATIAGYLENIV